MMYNVRERSEKTTEADADAVETIRPAGRDAGPTGLVGLQKEVGWRLPSLAIRFPGCSTDRATADKHDLKWVTSGRPLFDALRISPTCGAIGW